MARKRRKTELRAGELNLTAMIDIAFQMLSFFLVTAHPVDVIAHLNVFRPAPQPTTEISKPINAIQIAIFYDGITINSKQVNLNQLEGLLSKLADLDKRQTILIMCTPQSAHRQLVEVLDMCAKVGLVNLSVVSST